LKDWEKREKKSEWEKREILCSSPFDGGGEKGKKEKGGKGRVTCNPPFPPLSQWIDRGRGEEKSAYLTTLSIFFVEGKQWRGGKGEGE